MIGVRLSTIVKRYIDQILLSLIIIDCQTQSNNKPIREANVSRFRLSLERTLRWPVNVINSADIKPDICFHCSITAPLTLQSQVM